MSVRIRFVESVTDDHIAQAVMTARAVVKLADQVEDLKEQIAERDRRLEQARESADRRETADRKERDKLFAVERLHSERERVACGDGCCHEGIGICDHCEQSYPCPTARVAAGKPPQPSGTEGGR